MGDVIKGLQDAQDAILAEADKRPEGERTLTEDEVQRYEKLEADIAAAQKDQYMRSLHAKARLVTAGPAVIQATPKGDDALGFAFEQYLRTGIGNADLTAFAQSEGTTTAGGYAVPDSSYFQNRLVEARKAVGGFMSACENVTTASGNPLEWASVAAVSPTTSIGADIAAEGAATAAGADIVFGTVTLGAYKYTSAGTGNAALKVSVELLQDAMFDINGFVAKRLGQRITSKQSYDLINGSNSGEPQGIMYGTSGTIEHDPDGYAAFSNLVHALDPAYRQLPGTAWVFSDATAAIIEQLLDGASGTSGRPMLQTSTRGMDASADPTFSGYTLLGYPVIIDQACPTWAADNVIGAAFGNWPSAYIVRHVRDTVVIVNPYTSAITGQVEYSAYARMDGKVQDSTAYVTGEGT